ncbi:MAG: SDR family NAD(P)-dependent oxidoreductase, partial [Dermatophilaceae bacterium]
AASKAAVASYSDALRHEVASLGISVSTVQPGFHRTHMTVGDPAAAPTTDYDAIRPAVLEAIEHSLESGGPPTRVAALVSRIAGTNRPRARYRVGRDAVWLPRVRPLMPEPMFESGVRRSFGLPGRRLGTVRSRETDAHLGTDAAVARV